MYCKLFIIANIFNMIIANICIASTYKHNDDSYKCRLGSKTPYRCIANYDDSPLKYPSMYKL